MEESHNFWFEFIALIVLLALSGFFSASETALTAASKARMLTLENDGNARARLLNRLREKKDKMIGALLLGNTLINILAGALTTSVLIEIFGDAGVLYATVIVTALVLIFSEVLPKTYALMKPDKLALILTPLVAIVVAVFSPVTYAVAKIVEGIFRLFGVKTDITPDEHEEELRGAIELFKDTLDIEEDQQKGKMLRSILDLADVHVEEIMVHRKNVRMINAEQPIAKIIDEVLHSSFTRLPVYQETQDNIIGVIHTKLLLMEMSRCNGDINKVDIKKTMMEPWFIPESTTLFDQLEEFRKRREHFSIMVDEYGALMGVVTLEDILEEIVGEISDEHDKVVNGVSPQPDGSYLIDGKVTIRDLNREMDWGLPDEEYSTIAGLVLFEAQRIPSVGQTFTFYNFRFEVLKKQKNQITQLRVMPINLEEEGAKSASASA